MATRNEVKIVINKMVELLDSLNGLVGVDEASGGIGDAFKKELAKFLMYLSASDGEIKWAEASTISDLCDLNLTPQNVGDFIRKNNIYSTEFESKVPVTLDLLVKTDNLLVEMNKSDEVPDATGVYISTFKYAADQLITSDGDVDDTERADCNIYINMMEEYVSKHSTRKASPVSGFTKNSGGVSAPAKNGVAAPRKKG